MAAIIEKRLRAFDGFLRESLTEGRTSINQNLSLLTSGGLTKLDADKRGANEATAVTAAVRTRLGSCENSVPSARAGGVRVDTTGARGALRLKADPQRRETPSDKLLRDRWTRTARPPIVISQNDECLMDDRWLKFQRRYEV